MRAVGGGGVGVGLLPAGQDGDFDVDLGARGDGAPEGDGVEGEAAGAAELAVGVRLGLDGSSNGTPQKNLGMHALTFNSSPQSKTHPAVPSWLCRRAVLRSWYCSFTRPQK